MTVFFRTNIDFYKNSYFPDNITEVPRVGDYIEVTREVITFVHRKDLPTQLQVVRVVWTEDGVSCELHYSDFQMRDAKFNGINLFP